MAPPRPGSKRFGIHRGRLTSATGTNELGMAQIELETAIIDAGQAEAPLARALAGAGRQAALVEREHVGGSCVNWNCTPSKAMISSSRLVAQARRASEWGISIPQVEADLAAVVDRKRDMAEGARGDLQKSRSSEANLCLARCHARLVVAEAGTRRILGAATLCDSGSEVVQLFVELMNAGATADTMLGAVHIHPTLGEAALNAVAALRGDN